MLEHRRNRVASPPPDCALTVCVKYMSGSWIPNILWYLGEHPRRFMELKQDLRGVSAKVLVQRLRRLQNDGLVARAEIDSSPRSIEYSLTDLGRSLRPALEAPLVVGRKIKQRQL